MTRDLRTFIALGKALWPDPERSETVTLEMFSAISLLNLSEEKTLNKAAAALLDQAVKQGMAANTQGALEAGVFTPFFRLYPHERMVLVALHLGRWTYQRIAEVMGETSERIEAIAWKARVRLAAAQGFNHPMGAGGASPNCPHYDTERPWTQRFLDEEIEAGREVYFLQNHLLACPSCQQALTRCRELYYAVEGLLPRVEEADPLVQNLKHLTCEARRLLGTQEITFGQSLIAFFRQRDVQLILSILFFAALILLFRRSGP